MPMFDDPGKALRKLEEELLAEEADLEEECDEYEDEDTPVIRNHANGYGTRPVNYAVDFDRMAYADEDIDDDDVYYEEDYRSDRKKKKEKKKKGVGGLILLAFLVLAGIAAVIWWWIRWISGNL